jgi:hypothetical protein
MTLLARLRAHRLAADLSYEALADRIAAVTGRRFSASTLFRLCTATRPVLQDRTATRLEQYLHFVADEEAYEKRRAPRRRRQGRG